MREKKFLLLFHLLFTAAYLSAETIVVNPNPVVTANAITNNVTGADLAGLIVTATYGEPSGSLVSTSTWVATGPTSGSASAGSPPSPISAFAVSVNGDANGTLAWHYTSIVLGPLISLQFDGTTAGIYFDRAHSGAGTPGSGPGADIVFSPLSPAGIESSIVVTYSDAVALDGGSPAGDLYARLSINFPNSNSAANFFPQDFEFTQDTDRNVVPEPSSWLLAIGGLSTLGLIHRRWFRRV